MISIGSELASGALAIGEVSLEEEEDPLKIALTVSSFTLLVFGLILQLCDNARIRAEIQKLRSTEHGGNTIGTATIDWLIAFPAFGTGVTGLVTTLKGYSKLGSIMSIAAPLIGLAGFSVVSNRLNEEKSLIIERYFRALPIDQNGWDEIKRNMREEVGCKDVVRACCG